MSQKIVIVGGVAGGASTAAKLRRNSEENQIIMFERGPHVSFSNCSLPYHLSGIVEEANDLVLMSPEIFQKQYNIGARVDSEVIEINRTEKKVTVRTSDGSVYKESYDKLVLSPGAMPIVPPFKGMDEIPVFTLRNVVDVDMMNMYLKELKERKVTVIGGGFIGIEVAENLAKAGFEVTLIEAMDQILRPFDYDMVQILHKEMTDHGIRLLVGEKVECFEPDTVILASGRKVETQAVIMAIGVAPETQLAKSAGLEIGALGGIAVDKNYRTSDPDIYAVGDAIEVYHALTHSASKISLAGPALKQARSVANHISGKETINKGYIGSSAIRVFDYNAASTGLNEGMIKAQKLNLNYDFARVILNDKVGLMPDASPMHLKLLFEVPTGKILGAQAIGKGDVTKRIDVIATAIKFGGTVQDLRDLELSYAPPFATAKDVVNYAGYIGTNILNKEFCQVNVDAVRGLVEQGSVIIDVREKGEFARGHIKGAVNIPLSQLRERVEEVPKDVPVYLHCRSGQRSYNATLALQNLGYQNVTNITGSFLGISLYEYYDDQRLNREPIVTEYNFN